MDIKEILAEVKRGCAEIIDEARIEDLIKNYYEKGENFYVKAGFDPTAPDLHLGHSVVLSKMAFLQKHGARVQFLIGDFTGQIGDPSGKNATRKKLSQEEVLKNAKTYESQVFKILDKNKTDIVFNSKWLNELGAAGIVELTSTFSVARMLEREDFTKRFREQSSISICEFLYPLLQGYDSVALKSDIEMGGTDQKFNLLMGRTLQRIYDAKKEQAIIMMPLLEGLDGVNKMSKSLNNYIGVTENAKDIYAKILSISDELGAAGIVELTSTFSVARMLEREDFTKRFREQSSISICEFLYPLLQGYDSVALKSDIEMGGTDQKFNLLMGRTLQRIYDAKKEQAIIMMPLLEGLDGVNKMSKSLNNYIGVTENAKDIYAKILSISDELMFRYCELLSKKSLKEIETIKENIQNGSLHPKIVKENLALELVERFHSKELADEAKAEFDRVHSANALPSEITEFEIGGGSVWLAKALVECGLENSTSAARRAIVANSVSVNSQKVKDEQMQLELGEYILQIGKRKFARLKVKK